MSAEVAGLKAQVRGLQALLLDNPAGVDTEPRTRVSDGRYMAVISAISTAGPKAGMTVDFVTPDNSSEFSTYKNRWVVVQRFPFYKDLAIAVWPTNWTGDYQLYPDWTSPVIITLDQLATHWNADLQNLYYVTVAYGQVRDIEQVYSP